jgi:DNA-binding HxlR family transcriptional regulator
MRDPAVSAERAGGGVKKSLQPCIDVIYGGDYYKITLGEVVKSHLEGRPTHCREIARRTNIHFDLVHRALKTLEECGYVEALKREAAPKKGSRKPYRPTPLGVVMHAILALPHIKGQESGREGGILLKEKYAYAIACWLAESLPPLLERICTLHARSQGQSRQAEIEKGCKTALHAIGLLCMEARAIEGGSRDPKGLLEVDLEMISNLLNAMKYMPQLWCLAAVSQAVKDSQEVEIDRVVDICLEEVKYLEGMLNLLKTMLQLDHGSRQGRSRSSIIAQVS